MNAVSTTNLTILLASPSIVTYYYYFQIYRVGGLVGCIRRAAVSGRAEDLVRSAATHRRVGQCFPNVEQAAHFSGTLATLFYRHF